MVTRGVDPERPLCPSCSRTPVPAGHLCCPPCWKEIPPSLQRGVMLALRQWRANPTDENWDRYTAHRTQALEALQ